MAYIRISPLQRHCNIIVSVLYEYSFPARPQAGIDVVAEKNFRKGEFILPIKKILIVNQKGGIGKSMVSDEIAFHFERLGVPTAFLDLDSQGGTVHKMDRNPNAAVAVIDTPGALQPRRSRYGSQRAVRSG